MKIAHVSNIPVCCSDWPGVLDVLQKRISDSTSGGYISITNTESMYHALRIEHHLEYIKSADLSLCDGIGSVIAGFAWSENIPRLNGPVLVLKACEYGQKHDWKHFFYGGAEGVADEMVNRLKKQFPDMNSVGTYCPPFRELTPEEDQEVIDMINEAKPDIVWVGLGLLKQEKWIADHLDQIQAPWMSGVGAAFDYHSGNVPWAPSWIQAIGMEWLYRTIIQPHKRIKRYYWSFIFMFESIWEALKSKFNSKG